MNQANGGKGYLGRTDWRLPTTPPRDETCDRKHKNTFGFGCTGSDMGALYTRGMGLHWPATAVVVPPYVRGQFKNLQPYLYWSETENTNHKDNVNGFTTFSFANGFQGANVSDNHLYVIPMLRGRALGSREDAQDRAAAKRFTLATVYDSIADVTWLTCQGDPKVPHTCGTEPPADGFQWSFSFGNGFQGTTTNANKLYVMVYHPGPP